LYFVNHYSQFSLEYNATLTAKKIFKKKLTPTSRGHIKYILEKFGHIILNNADIEENLLNDLFDIVFSEGLVSELDKIIKNIMKYAKFSIYYDMISLNVMILEAQIKELKRKREPNEDDEYIGILMSKIPSMKILDHLFYYQDIFMASDFQKYNTFQPKILTSADFKNKAPADTPRAIEGMNRKSRKLNKRQTRKK
jgi:hypothetical protein